MVWSIHTMPMYHGMGALQLCWTVNTSTPRLPYSKALQASSGTVMAAFEPKSPAVVPTPDNLFKAAVATNSDVIFCVPAFIEVSGFGVGKEAMTKYFILHMYRLGLAIRNMSSGWQVGAEWYLLKNLPFLFSY